MIGRNRSRVARMTEQKDSGKWLTVTEAADRLRITPDAVRQRVKRGILSGARGNDGRVKVWLTDLSIDQSVKPDRSISHDGPIDQTRQSVTPTDQEPERPEKVIDPIGQTYQKTDPTDRLIAHLERQLSEKDTQHRAEIERIEARHSAELSRLERAYRAATDALMERVATVLVANGPRPWWRLFG